MHPKPTRQGVNRIIYAQASGLTAASAMEPGAGSLTPFLWALCALFVYLSIISDLDRKA